MPQLPSGRHIAIRLDPLTELLQHADDPGNVHRVMAITDINGLAPYVEIMFLVPHVTGDELDTEEVFAKGSLPCPPGLRVVSSGKTLAQLGELSFEWNDDDRRSFQDFLETRCQKLFALGLSEAQTTQQRLLKESSTTARLLAHWYQAGCHPCQEKGWEESVSGTTDWDTYDMLAALGQLSVLLPQHQDVVERLGFAHGRLQGVWASLRDRFPLPDGWPSAEMDVRICAEMARAADWLSSLPEERQHWLRRQCVIECVNLWKAGGEGFQGDFPSQYGIIELVVVSREADSCFDG